MIKELLDIEEKVFQIDKKVDRIVSDENINGETKL